MATMPMRIRSAFEAEMYDARTAGDVARRRAHLERAHILSQPYPWPHTRNHLSMLALAVREGDLREATGQVARVAQVVTARVAQVVTARDPGHVARMCGSPAA